MAHVTLILGGARSGKSARAEALTTPPRAYIATAEALDDEMAARIALHRADRGAGWTLAEAPLELAPAIGAQAVDGTSVLVDCLTLWLSNLLGAGRDPAPETDALIAALNAAPGRIILVSNEIGLGLVPETPVGRAFRDAQGRLNQRIAAIADRVEFVAAGLPMVLKDDA